MKKLYCKVLVATIGSLTMNFSIPSAFSTELDREETMKNVQVRPVDLPATLVIRVSDKNQQVEILHLSEELKEEVLDPIGLEFEVIEKGKTYASSDFIAQGGRQELDKEQGQESWYFYWGFTQAYYYPSYWYGGYTYYYRPYYNYRYRGYSYSYYRHSSYYRCCW